MIRNLEYQNQQLKKEVEELKSQVECLLENPTQQDWDALIESDCKKGERINELLGEMDEIIDYYEKGF